jgi:hypothetical protein
MDLVSFILNLDRRIIYAIVAICIAVPLIVPFKLPIKPTTEVLGVYNAIDALPEGSHILISADFDPSSKPELLPALHALLQHCFAKGIKPHLLTLWPSGPGLMQTAIEAEARKFNKVSGTDYSFLGFRYGTLAVVLGMASNIPATFATDFYGKPTATMPIYQEVSKISQLNYIVDLAAGASVETWITFASEPQKVPIGACVTAVSATQYYPYLQAHQLTGLVGGMKGAAEYEKLVTDNYQQPPGDATKGMTAQSFVHIFIVLSIIAANICFFIAMRREQAKRRAS